MKHANGDSQIWDGVCILLVSFLYVNIIVTFEASEVIQRAESLWEVSPKSKVEFWPRGSAGSTQTQLIIPDNSSLEPKLQKKAFFSMFMPNSNCC